MNNPIVHAGNLLQQICHLNSRNAGWWNDKDGTPLLDKPFRKYVIATKLALIHSEVSEGLEGSRKDLMDDHLPHRPMLEVELADALIRICDLAGALGYDLGGAIAEKLAYNAQRPDHKKEAREQAGGKSV